MRHESTFNHFLEYSHLFVGLLIGAVVVLHALGALKHHFVDKDVVLKRMLYAGKSVNANAEHRKAKAPMSAEQTNLPPERTD